MFAAARSDEQDVHEISKLALPGLLAFDGEESRSNCGVLIVDDDIRKRRKPPDRSDAALRFLREGQQSCSGAFAGMK
jgi:hypothetical protein